MNVVYIVLGQIQFFHEMCFGFETEHFLVAMVLVRVIVNLSVMVTTDMVFALAVG